MSSHRSLSEALFILGLFNIISGVVVASDAVGYEMISPPLIKTITTYPYFREGVILILIGAFILLIAYMVLFRSFSAIKKKLAESAESK